jgi:NADH-quinone oxidoreductase subunit N
VKFLTNLKLILGSDALLNFIFSINMFSMSGIPPLAGFFVKFDILFYIINSSNFYLSFFILLATVANFFYYLRMIKIIYFENTNMDFMYKSKNIVKADNTSKYFIITTCIHIILFFVLYYERTFFFILDNILKSLI